MPADTPYYLEKPDAPPSGGFGDLASQAGPDLSALRQRNEADIAATRERQQKARDEERTALESKAAETKANIAPIEQAMGQRDALAQQRPAPLQLTPPPTRKLTDFLATTEGETPENSITKLIQGVGLLASGFTGLHRKNASTALASLSGALKGWQEGDKERADRAFSDWQAQTDRVITEHRDLVRNYKDIMQDADTNIGQKVELLRYKAIAAGDQAAVKAFDTRNANEDLKFLEGRETQIMKLEEGRLRIAEMHQRNLDNKAFLLQLQQMKVEQKKAADDSLVGQYTPEALKALGQQWVMTGKLPSGVGVGKAGAIVKGMVTKAGIEWAKEQGLDPMNFPAIQSEINSAKSSLTKLMGANAIQQASIRRFDGHADALLRLSDMVPRSEMPAVNNAILKGERDYKGSPEAAAFVAQAFELGMELSKVVVGTAQGDSGTREHARQVISGSLNREQLKAVVAQLRQNAERNMETNKRSEKEISGFIDTVGGRTAGSTPNVPIPPPPMGSADDPLGILKPKGK